MDSFSFIACILLYFHKVTADAPFQGIFRQAGPCFEVTKLPDECNVTLAKSFRPDNKHPALNEPETLVFLFTPKNPDIAEALHLCGGKLPPGSTYDPQCNTEIFIHGWLDGVCRTAWMREMKDQLFMRGHYNVILIDWTWGNFPDYIGAGSNSRIVGKQLGFVLNNIMKQTNVDPEKFHVIGHSFGAIAAGFTGRSVTGKLRRITGLDPAYAPLGHVPPNERLTHRDARIVDIIHSNSARCFAIGIGDSRVLGHADFYPNGGLVQKSCYPYILTSLLKGDYFYALASLIPVLCSHLQSLQYYKVSINSNKCQFVGMASGSYKNFTNGEYSRDDYAVMGMDYEHYHGGSKRRKFYLTTRNECPYYDVSYLNEEQKKEITC